MSRVLHLVDASPYIFRAFHTLPETMRDPEGRPTNAVHGFLDFLLKLVREEKVTHLAVCFDFDLVKGFAVGRTIFGEVARAWMKGETDDAAATAEMARRYARLCEVWDEARAAAREPVA